MKTNPSIRKIWHGRDREVQPTCYDARNPAMPWLPAAELGFDDADDRADASAWLCVGGPAESIGTLQKRTSSPAQLSTATVPPIPDLFQLPIIQQLANAARTRPNLP